MRDKILMFGITSLVIISVLAFAVKKEEQEIGDKIDNKISRTRTQEEEFELIFEKKSYPEDDPKIVSGRTILKPVKSVKE